MVSSPRRRHGRCWLKSRCSRGKKRRKVAGPLPTTFIPFLLITFSRFIISPLYIFSSSFPLAPIFLVSAHTYLSYTHLFYFSSIYPHTYPSLTFPSAHLSIYPFRFSSPHTTPLPPSPCTSYVHKHPPASFKPQYITIAYKDSSNSKHVCSASNPIHTSTPTNFQINLCTKCPTHFLGQIWQRFRCS